MTSVRSVHVVGSHALQTLELRVSSALESWCRGWLPAGSVAPKLSLAAQPCPPVTHDTWHAYAAEAGRAWIRRGDSLDDALASALLGGVSIQPGRDTLLMPVLAQARAERDRVVVQALVGDAADPAVATPPDTLFAPGSGAVFIVCAPIGLSLLVDAGALRHVPPIDGPRPALPPLAPLRRAAQRAVLALDVSLGAVELELGALLSLQVGDVICLPKQLADPATVHAGDELIAAGQLGAQHGLRAIRLVPKTSIANRTP